jgi:flavodoxin
MDIQVLYHTKTGHSRKIAQAVAQAVGVQARDIAQWQEETGCDVLFLVGGIYGGKSDQKMLDLVPRLHPDHVARVVLVTSCTSGTTQQADLRAALLTRGIAVDSEEFLCLGSFLIFRLGRPNQQDLAEAGRFALRKAQE